MNRVFFLILFISLLVIPLSINNANSEGISYFELITEIGAGLIKDSEPVKEVEIIISEEQKAQIRENLDSITNSQNSFFNQYESLQIDTLKGVNALIAKHRWETFSKTNNGIKGIYLSGYHLLREEKINPIKEIVNNTIVNTIVLDVKTDNGHLMYDSQIESVEELNNERIKYDSTTLKYLNCLLYTSPSPRDRTRSRMPSSA